VYDDVNDTCTYCARRGLPCSEKDFAGPQHQIRPQAREKETNGSIPTAFEVSVPNSVDLSTAPGLDFLEEAVSLPTQTAPTETESILSRFGEQTQPQNQRQASTTQENETSHPTLAAIEGPLPSSVDSSTSMPGPRHGFLEEAISVSPPGPVQAASMETGSQSILSRLSNQKDMPREWAMELHSLFGPQPPQSPSLRHPRYYYFEDHPYLFPPGLAKILGCPSPPEVEINREDLSDWSLSVLAFWYSNVSQRMIWN